jgi:hypothetical protein
MIFLGRKNVCNKSKLYNKQGILERHFLISKMEVQKLKMEILKGDAHPFDEVWNS